MSRFNVKFLPQHYGHGFSDNLMPTISAVRADHASGLALVRAAVNRVAPMQFAIITSAHADTLAAELWRRNPDDRATFTEYATRTGQSFGGLSTPLPASFFANPPYSAPPHAVTPEPSILTDGAIAADRLAHVLLLTLYWDYPESFESSAANPFTLADLRRDFESGLAACEAAVHRVASSAPFTITEREHRRDLAASILMWEPSTVWSNVSAVRADALALQALTNFTIFAGRVTFDRNNQQAINAKFVGLFDQGSLTSKTEFRRLLAEVDSTVPGSETDHEAESHAALVASTDAVTRRREIYRLRQRLIRAGRGGNAPFVYSEAA